MVVRRFRYVGPEDVRRRWADQPAGQRIVQAADLATWLQDTDMRSGLDGLIQLTFVVDDAGVLRVEDYGYEHVACAAGGPVRGAGVLSVDPNADPVAVIEVTNQSTGFCPAIESWAAVAEALDAAGLPHPGRFTTAFEFRRCPACGQRNLVKDDWYFCGLCDAALPAAWNFHVTQ